MKKIIVFIGILISGFIVQEFLYSHENQFLSYEDSAVYVTEIVNNSDVPLIISFPRIVKDSIVVTKNISLQDQSESIPSMALDSKYSLFIPAQTKSFIANLRLPKVDEHVTVPANFTLRPNNYNPLTMQAICFHIPPQNYRLNYTLVHKPLPIFALRQKGDFLDTIPGEGLRNVLIQDQLSSLKSDRHTHFYTIEVNQVKPIGYVQSIRHQTHELYDLSAMYLDGGAEVEPLSVNPETFDIVISRNNSFE